MLAEADSSPTGAFKDAIDWVIKETKNWFKGAGTMMAGIRPQSILMLCAYAATPLWLVWIFGHLYMQDLTLRQFYGEGIMYALQVW